MLGPRTCRLADQEDFTTGLEADMWNLQKVTTISYQGDYIYRILFDDGTEGNFDFSPYLDRGPLFSALRDQSFFQKAYVEGYTIAWPNGLDIAPETLLEGIVRSKKKARSKTVEFHDAR